MTAIWPIPQTAREMFRRGETSQALSEASAVLASNPFSADAMVTRALVHLSGGNTKDAIADLRAASELRSPYWMYERFRSELISSPQFSISIDNATKLGAFLRQRLLPLGPVVKDRKTTGHSSINVVGTSLVRSFGGQTCFLPIFVGMGPGMLLLTAEGADVARRKIIENLKRLDVSRPTMLILGADAYYHVENLLKLRASAAAPLEAADFDLMEAVAERHRPILEEARKLVTGRLMLLCSTPAHDDRMNALSHRLNAQLARIARETNVELLDWWRDLADPVTDKLADRHCANAYPGDIHFSLDTTSLFVDKLKEIGVLDAAYKSERNYEWTHVFECDIGVGEKTRIWCEPNISPNNAVKSSKIAASHIYGKVADLLAATLLGVGPVSALYVNVRDGYLPTAMPTSIVPGSVALARSARDVEIAQSVLEFWGRPDVTVRPATAKSLAELSGFRPAVVIGATYPDSVDDDIATLNAALSVVPHAHVVAVMVTDPKMIERLALPAGYDLSMKTLMGHRFVPESWQQATLFVFRKRAAR